MTFSRFATPQNRSLAYRRTDGQRPGLIWLSGFKSDMQGSKVLALENWAKATGRAFLAFDYSGHGESAGSFRDGTIGTWHEDTLAILDGLTEGPQILVGSSMGGWQALLAARARPTRISGLILIAPAPDFTEKLMWPSLSKAAQDEVLEKGVHLQPSEYGEPVALTHALFEDGKTWQLLDAPFSFDGPVRILQGMQDPDVPWQHAERLVSVLTTPDLVFSLIKDGDHRLSRDQDIARLITTVEEVCQCS